MNYVQSGRYRKVTNNNYEQAPMADDPDRMYKLFSNGFIRTATGYTPPVNYAQRTHKHKWAYNKHGLWMVGLPSDEDDEEKEEKIEKRKQRSRFKKKKLQGLIRFSIHFCLFSINLYYSDRFFHHAGEGLTPATALRPWVLE